MLPYASSHVGRRLFEVELRFRLKYLPRRMEEQKTKGPKHDSNYVVTFTE